MKRHYIPVTADIPGVGDERKAFVRKVIRTALAAEGVDFPCEVDVLLTNDAHIHERRTSESPDARKRRGNP